MSQAFNSPADHRREAFRTSPATSAAMNAGSSSAYVGKKFEPASDNNISADGDNVLAFTITQEEYTSRVQAAMVESVAGTDSPSKRLARTLGCSIGTAKNYLEGRTTPSGIHDMRAMAVIPGYRALKLEIAGISQAVDARHHQKVAEFMKFCAEQAPKIFGGEA